MSWLYERRLAHSDQNGPIFCERLLGRWRINVEGYGQTSPWTTGMWKDAFSHMPRTAPIRRVLLLGLGGGGLIRPLRRRFPDCEITAVEWDPVMAALPAQLGIVDANTAQHLRVLVGDAAEVVPMLEGTFDLIIIDLFRGPLTSPHLAEDPFISAVKNHLAPQGFLLVNLFKSVDVIPLFDRAFGSGDIWWYQYNYLALYAGI